ncbi:hypothetical protein R6Z07F_014501 [Ovis aries]
MPRRCWCPWGPSGSWAGLNHRRLGTVPGEEGRHQSPAAGSPLPPSPSRGSALSTRRIGPELLPRPRSHGLGPAARTGHASVSTKPCPGPVTPAGALELSALHVGCPLESTRWVLQLVGVTAAGRSCSRPGEGGGQHLLTPSFLQMTPTLAAPSGVLAVLTLITEASAVPTHGAPSSATIEHGALSLPGVSSVPRALLGPVGPHSTPLLGFSCKNPGKLASGRQDSTPDNADLSFLSVWAPCRKDGSSGGQPLMVLGERLL